MVGSDELRLRSHDPTGKLVQEGYFWSSLVSPQGRWRSEYSVILPFSEDGAKVSQIRA